MGLVRFAEFVSNLRVNSKALKASFFARRTGIVKNVLRVLYQEGFISGFFAEDSRQLGVSLKYYNHRPVINSVKIYTRPGHSIFYSRDQMLRNFGPFFPETFVFSTNKGICSNHNLNASLFNYSDKLPTSNGNLLSRFQLMPHYYFIELKGYTFYDLNFFAYKGCFDPVFEENLQVNVKFLDFFDNNTQIFFYLFSDKNLRSFPFRFFSFLTRFISNYNFVSFSSSFGIGNFFKFIVSFLLNFSKYFSTGFLARFSKRSAINFGNLRRVMKNFFFVCLEVIDSTLIVSPLVSHFISLKSRFYIINRNFGDESLFFKKHFFNNVKALMLNSGLVSKDHDDGKLPFYSSFCANVNLGLFRFLGNPINLRGVPDFFFRMTLSFCAMGSSLFFPSFFRGYVSLLKQTIFPFFSKDCGYASSFRGNSLAFGWRGGRGLNLLPFLFYFCRAFGDCVEILIKMGLFDRKKVNIKKNIFCAGGPLLIRLI